MRLLFILSVFLLGAAECHADAFVAPLRVGIVVFRARPADLAAYDKTFTELSKTYGAGGFELAVGTQADIVGWVERGWVDLALVDQGTASALHVQQIRAGSVPWTYVASAVEHSKTGRSRNESLVIANPKGVDIAKLRSALTGLRPSQFEITSEGPGLVHAALPSTTPGGQIDRLSKALNLDLIASMFVQHRCVNPNPLRIAVVFSGGGAKCAFQAGAIRAVEEKLSELRARYNDPSFDISLVVGTSGGAVNAVPVALGLSRTPLGQSDFSAAWNELDQRELIRPSPFVRGLMVFWFVCVQGLLVLRVRRVRHFKNPERYPWIISRQIITLGIFEIVLARLPMKPWTLMGESPALHKFWLWLTWGLEGSGWTLVTIGLISAALRKVPAVYLIPFQARYRVVRNTFLVGAVLTPLAQTILILFCQPTLSDSLGLERVLTRTFGSLINAQLARDGKELIELSTTKDPATALRDFSRALVERKALKRDLVLTGSALPRTTTEAAGDIYFYMPVSPESEEPKFGARGVSLLRRPALFMDALLASGAIYPVFPARTMPDVPRPGDVSEVVDGSFEHRSPIEAAVLWGATHIILIQAATDEIVPRGAFIENVNAAMNHLYDQAQLLDFRSREHVETFSLTPRPPHIGLLDFADNLISQSIVKGYQEAIGKVDDAGWRKEFGEPTFWIPGKTAASPYCSKREC